MPDEQLPGEDALARAEELLERLERARADLERAVAAEDADAAVDILAELRDLAKAVEDELARARRAAG